MLRVRKSELAKEDLITLWLDGYNQRGEQQANTYLDNLETKIKSLVNSPERYPLKKQFKPPIRICPHQSHHIVYTVIDNDAVYIVRVLRKEMDIELHL